MEAGDIESTDGDEPELYPPKAIEPGAGGAASAW